VKVETEKTGEDKGAGKGRDSAFISVLFSTCLILYLFFLLSLVFSLPVFIFTCSFCLILYLYLPVA